MATKTVQKQSCPTCGQSVNQRYIALNKEMVRSLSQVLAWAKANDRLEFTRKEISHLLKTETEVARFGDWVYFGGILYRHHKQKGAWGIIIPRADAFLSGEMSIVLEVLHDPLTKATTPTRHGYVGQVKSLSVSIDKDHNYVVEYEKKQQQLSDRVKNCANCDGTGGIDYQVQLAEGAKGIKTKCGVCKGSGKVRV